MIYKHCTNKSSFRYIDVLEDLVHTYNSRIHRSLGKLSPLEAELPQNRLKVLDEFEKRYLKLEKKNSTFRIGDLVRLSKPNSKFKRSYHIQAGFEVFRIFSVNHRHRLPSYQIEALNKNEVIDGYFR